MLAECVGRFYDKEAKCIREVGDRFEVSSGRFAAINSAGHGELVAEATGATETPAETNDGQTPKKANTTPKRATRGRRKTKE